MGNFGLKCHRFQASVLVPGEPIHQTISGFTVFPAESPQRKPNRGSSKLCLKRDHLDLKSSHSINSRIRPSKLFLLNISMLSLRSPLFNLKGPYPVLTNKSSIFSRVHQCCPAKNSQIPEDCCNWGWFFTLRDISKRFLGN